MHTQETTVQETVLNEFETHLDSTSHGGMVQRSVAKLEAHARNNSTGKKFLGSLSVDHNHNNYYKSKQNNAEWNSTVCSYGTTCLVLPWTWKSGRTSSGP